jgi:hypothetical protein
MTGPLDSGIVLLLLKFYAAMIILEPVLLRTEFRFEAKLNPQLVPVESRLQHAAASVQNNF